MLLVARGLVVVAVAMCAAVAAVRLPSSCCVIWRPTTSLQSQQGSQVLLLLVVTCGCLGVCVIYVLLPLVQLSGNPQLVVWAFCTRSVWVGPRALPALFWFAVILTARLAACCSCLVTPSGVHL